MNMQPISTASVNVKAYQELKRAIMSAYFQPGEILTMGSLSKMLGTSLMPVREALKQLAAERAVEALPNRSTRIPKLSLKRMQEIVHLRVMLEGYAAAEAARNRTAADLAKIETEHEAALKALSKGNLQGYLQHNTEFHFAIYRAAGIETLLPIVESLWLQYAPSFTASLGHIAAKADQVASVTRNHHDGIISALKNGDAELARQEVAADILSPTETEGFWELLEAE